MSAIKKTIIAGKLIFEQLIARNSVRRGEKRAARQAPTVEEVEKTNRRNAERTLQIKLHHNFKPGDYHIVLTYGGEAPTKEEAEKAFTKFRDKLRRMCKKEGKEFKWMAVTEYENKRPHHHLVMNNVVPADTIRELWKHGFIHDRRLSEDGDWRKLGEYLIKETDKTFRDPDAPSRLRYTCSRNLSMPPVYREEVTLSDVLDEPKPVKGYYIDKDSIYKGADPFSGRPYVEYVMLPVDDSKTRKRFNKRAKEKYHEKKYDKWLKKNAPKQTEMELPF